MHAIHRTSIDLLLSAVHLHVCDDGMMSSFFFGKPGAPMWDRRLGVEIYFSLKAITRAALYVRKNGPAHLRALSISDIRGLLTDFLQENYYYVGEETFLKRFKESFAEHVSEAAKEKLAMALGNSGIFQPVNYPTLFPLGAIKVESCFSAPPFFLRKPETLLAEFPSEYHRWIDPEHFPPLTDSKARKDKPMSWLGVRAPVRQAAEKTKAAVLGAVALTFTEGYRYMFSGRTVSGGVCELENGGSSFSFGGAHTPPLMENAIIRGCDHEWLGILAAKLGSNDPSDQRQVRALEYFYRAWDLKAHERFPWHCMALEAAYSKKGATTQSVIDGVRDTLGSHIEADRVRQILRVRGAVIHGEAPDVWDAEAYEAYYDTYSNDPVDDLALLTAAALRKRIFSDTIVDQVEPHQDILEEAQRRGRIPKKFRANSILDTPDESQAGDGGEPSPPVGQ